MSEEACPFHDLPSGTVVQIEFGDGRVLPCLAELACDEWHYMKAVEDFFRRCAALKASLGDLDGWRPSSPDDPWRIDRATLAAAERQAMQMHPGSPSLAKHVARVTRD